MIVVWSGAGGALLFIFCIADIICNFNLFLNYSSDKFDLLNWWLPCLLSAISAWFLAEYAKRLRANEALGNRAIRAILGTGASDSLYWIPLRTWSLIFLAIAVWQFIKK